MDLSIFKEICNANFDAIIKMLQEAINLCPIGLWDKRINEPPFWQQMYHTVYYLDFYLGESPESFKSKYTTKENLNEEISDFLTKEQLLDYLKDIQKKYKHILKILTEEELVGKNTYHWTGPTFAHRFIYNIRHAQHHIGALNSFLRRNVHTTVKWAI